MIDRTAHSLPVSQPAARPRVTVRLEVVAYAALFALALLLRLAELDTVPLSAAEARGALAAQRLALPGAPGESAAPSSALLLGAQALTFSVLGASPFTARLLTALAGALLVIAPLLFRRLLRPARAFVFSLLLAFSPVALLAAREGSPAVWALLAAAGGLWAVWRCWETRRSGYMLLAAACFAGVTFLTDPAGLWLALLLLAAGALALAWLRADEPDHPGLGELGAWLRGLPWLALLGAAALTVFTVGTLFALHLPGLGAVSESLRLALAGLTTAQPDTLPAYPLLIVVFYEPATIVFAAAGVWLLGRRSVVSLLDRFLAMWLLLSALAAVFFAGSSAAHALWLVAPLCGLASVTAAELLRADRHPLFRVPAWGRWLLALVIVLLLLILSVNLQAVGRSLLAAPPGVGFGANVQPVNLIWAGIALLLGVLALLLVASLWGGAAALRGGGLGLLAFALVTSLASGWSAAVPNAASPAELWHLRATGHETALLRETLAELSRRETSGFPLLTIYAQVAEDSPAAWALRDYPNTVFIASASDARAQPVALLPLQTEPPDLGGSYVGQQFILSRSWNPRNMQAADALAWWLQGRLRAGQAAAEPVVLWLRQDIYDGLPFDGGQPGG